VHTRVAATAFVLKITIFFVESSAQAMTASAAWETKQACGPRGDTMKKLLSIAGLCVAVIAAGVAAPAAHATTVIATWTGTLEGPPDSDLPYDTGDHFGGGMNPGDTITVKSVFDTSTGTFTNDASSDFRGFISGGGSATVSIGGGTPFSFALTPNSFGFNAFDSLGLDIGDSGLGTFLHLGFYDASLPTSLLTAFDGNSAPGYAFGTFFIADGTFAGANFVLDHLNIAVAAAATPIPATLPLLATPLLGLGFFARRKKANAAA